MQCSCGGWQARHVRVMWLSTIHDRKITVAQIFPIISKFSKQRIFWISKVIKVVNTKSMNSHSKAHFVTEIDADEFHCVDSYILIGIACNFPLQCVTWVRKNPHARPYIVDRQKKYISFLKCEELLLDLR